MKRLPLPRADVKKALELCLETVRDERLHAALSEAEHVLVDVEASYFGAAGRGELFLTDSAEDVGGLVTTKEMEALYKGNFSRQRSKARHIYDAIKLAPAHGICPLCGHRVVATLDHYLPKSAYPSLAITPANLVPACSDCNKLKLAHEADCAEDQSLHPYFDALPAGVWLHAAILNTSPPGIVFSALAPREWRELDGRRVVRHFEMFRLAELYGSQASSELVDISFGLAEIARLLGAAGLREHLQQQQRSRVAHDPNSWKSALYRALAESDWFHAEGYRLIRNPAE